MVDTNEKVTILAANSGTSAIQYPDVIQARFPVDCVISIPGDKSIRIQFKHVGKGLVCRHGDKLQGFEIAGKDHPWHWADAKIGGDTVVVSSEKVAEPVHVRCKSHNSCSWANLFAKDRWPAFAFNTRWLLE